MAECGPRSCTFRHPNALRMALLRHPMLAPTPHLLDYPHLPLSPHTRWRKCDRRRAPLVHKKAKAPEGKSGAFAGAPHAVRWRERCSANHINRSKCFLFIRGFYSPLWDTGHGVSACLDIFAHPGRSSARPLGLRRRVGRYLRRVHVGQLIHALGQVIDLHFNHPGV